MHKQLIAAFLLTGLIGLGACSQKKQQVVVENPQVDSLLSQMTLEEKIGMIHANSSFTSAGVERLGIPEMVMSDGPHGVRMEHGRDWVPDETDEDFATYLPTGIALASTWNKTLGYEYGKVLGAEARERKKNMILGPGLNIMRSPLNGRNFEYLSEDPYLTSKMGIGYIKGVQEQGVAACAKHYVANNQEYERHTINAVVSERALREIYLPAFKDAVEEANVLSIMSAYNKLNGTFCSSDKFLMNDLLRDEYNFKGLIVSDWAAVHETKGTLLHGVDIEMGTELPMLPNPDYDAFYLADSALAMAKSGEVDEKYLDFKVRNILNVMMELDMFDPTPGGSRNTEAHQQVALKVAEEGIVLLKNEEILPIKETVKTIAVIGANATELHATKGGSSQVKALYEVTPLEGIKKLAGENVSVLHAKGFEYKRDNKTNQKLLKEAVKTAQQADLVVFIGGWIHGYDNTEWGEGTFDAEALDKVNFELLGGQEELILAIAKANPNLVSVMYGGSAVKFGEWNQQSKAILQAWYPGMEGGNALANILFGKVNPSGKLPVSFAPDYSNYPDHEVGEYPGNGTDVVYKEDIYVGYRYFEKYKKDVVFPFGHGLSYTTFEMDNLKVENKKDANVKVSIEVSNTGDMDGSEVVQLYVSDKKSTLDRPLKELKGFEKVSLAKGETKTVTFELDKEAFSYFNPEMGWVLEPGTFDIKVGNSSANIAKQVSLEL